MFILDRILNFLDRKNIVRKKFTHIYDNNIFEGDESLSGKGSNLSQTEIIRQELPKLINELGIKTFVDAPCGDFFWMQKTNLPIQKYIGIDIVEKAIQYNNEKYHTDSVEFLCLDIITDRLPKADMIFCRDCLVHLDFRQALQAINNFKKSGSTYLLTTTFTDRAQNTDLGAIIWRTLNLQIAPFNLPNPIKLINEGCTEGNNEYQDKSLGLWRLSDISIK